MSFACTNFKMNFILCFSFQIKIHFIFELNEQIRLECELGAKDKQLFDFAQLYVDDDLTI